MVDTSKGLRRNRRRLWCVAYSEWDTYRPLNWLQKILWFYLWLVAAVESSECRGSGKIVDSRREKEDWEREATVNIQHRKPISSTTTLWSWHVNQHLGILAGMTECVRRSAVKTGLGKSIHPANVSNVFSERSEQFAQSCRFCYESCLWACRRYWSCAASFAW